MPNGILWSGIEGIAPVTRAFGATVMHPVNAVISIPMYGLWTVIAVIYLLMAYAAYLSFRKSQSKRGALFLGGIVLLSAGFVFDMLIDFGINRSYVYISEFIVLIYVVLMSLYLSDELRIYELNLEALVKQRTDALEQTNKELESFSYSVSHDLRAPLRAIHGFTNALDEDYGHLLDAGAKQFMQKISNNAKRMEAMINGLLQISRVNRGELNKIEVNISELAAQIVEQLKQQNPNRSVAVDIENKLQAHGDPSLLRVVLQNLLDNAWKFTQHVEDAKISIKKHVTVDGEKGFVVQDNGAGFNPDYKEKLFIPFQRLHSEEQYAGNGIGLATVARIVRRHGGKIWAEGQENQGASFYVILN
jgi:signal transduction histidine kinase